MGWVVLAKVMAPAEPEPFKVVTAQPQDPELSSGALLITVTAFWAKREAGEKTRTQSKSFNQADIPASFLHELSLSCFLLLSLRASNFEAKQPHSMGGFSHGADSLKRHI
jgi:hypothetical protein